MVAPPMRQFITLDVVKRDTEGEPIYDRNGRELRETLTTNARVKYSGQHIFTTTGNEANAVLEMRVPASLEIETGDIVKWIDPFGKEVTGPVAKIEDVQNYPGVVQYRKVWTTD